MALVELDLSPDAKKLRSFGLIALAFFGALGGWAFTRGTVLGVSLGESSREVGLGLLIVAAGSGALALLWPRGVLPLYIGMTLITLPIGFVMSHTIMLALFFFVVTPLGVAMRVLGWDAMDRRIDRAGSSYWQRRGKAPPAERYFRQF